MAARPQVLPPVAHQSINARRASRTSNGGGDLTVKDGDHAFYDPRLTNSCVLQLCSVRGWMLMSNNAFLSSTLPLLGRGRSLTE